MKLTHLTPYLFLAVVSLSGCRQLCCRNCINSAPAAPIGGSVQPGLAPVQFPNANNPIVTEPIKQTPIPQMSPVPQASPIPVPQQPSETFPIPDFPPPVQSKIPAETRKDSPWEGAPPQVYLGVPEPPIPDTPTPLPKSDGKDGFQLPPLPSDNKPKPLQPKQSEPPLGNPKPSPSKIPVGIPDFVYVVSGKVATGSRPGLDGGLDWLQKNGYKTVIQLKPPERDDSADRKQVNIRNMTYYSVNVSPDNLNRELIDAFVKAVTDETNQPIFIYDSDGTLRGSMWYLYYRLHEGRSNDVARVMAGQLGLNEQSDDQRAMWIAVQNYLSKLPQ